MIKKSIRIKTALFTSILLALCCIFLTLFINNSADRLTDSIQAIEITDTATKTGEEKNTTYPIIKLEKAKKNFKSESILYMVLIIVSGGILTYIYINYNLKSVETLNSKIKNINLNNLSESLPMPKRKDEIAELTNSFNQMTDKINNAFQSQQRFSSNAAHELRTPLTVMQLKMDVFKSKNNYSKQNCEKLMNDLETQTNKLKNIVNELLELTNDKNLEMNNTINLNDIFSEIFNELKPVLDKKNITYNILGNKNCVFYGNYDLMYRAFYNLIDNSIKYNFENGNIDVKFENINDTIKIKICDTGVGISDIDKKKVFEPFFRINDTKILKQNGSGLGLSIVEKIIEKHNGKIIIIDNQPTGTIFEIEIL